MICVCCEICTGWLVAHYQARSVEIRPVGINERRVAAHQYRRSSTLAQTAYQSIRVRSALARTRTKPLTIADEDQSATSERTTSQKIVGLVAGERYRLSPHQPNLRYLLRSSA